MPNIPYHASNFGRYQGRSLQGSNNLSVSWPDIIWASISVGKLDLADVFGHHVFSFREHQMKYYLIYGNLMQCSGAICKTSLYNSLDATEKGFISYFIGMMCAKLVSTFLLRVPWLIHLEKYKMYYNNLGLVGKRYPDLIGLDRRGEWVVIEAKGRTNAFSQNAMNNAKQQTRALRHISGQFPSLRVATESYFDSCQPSALSIQVCDPDDYDEQAEDVPIDIGQMMKIYYKPFSIPPDMPARPVEVRNRTFLVWDDEEFGVSIGIDKAILKSATLMDSPENYSYILTQEIDTVVEIEEHNLRLYPDGIVVGCGEQWNEERMRLEPQMRFRT